MRSKVLSLTTLLVASLASGQSKEPLHQIAHSLEVISAFWFTSLLYLLVAAWVSIISALMPEWVNRKVQTIWTQSPRSFLLGLVFTFVLGILIAVFGKIGETAPLAGVIAMLLLLLLLAGYSLGWVPVTWVIGRRIAALTNWELSDLSVALIGALVLHLLLFLPIVGWAVWFYWAIVAVGVWITRA